MSPKHVVARWKEATRLNLGPGKVEDRATATLQKMTKFPAKNRGDLQSATLSAAHFAQKTKQTMYLYSGNSFGHAVWRVSSKPGEYLDPINNTGDYLYSVTPDLVVARHEVSR